MVSLLSVNITCSKAAQLTPNSAAQQNQSQPNQAKPNPPAPAPTTPNPAALKTTDSDTKENIDIQRALMRFTKYLVVIGAIIGFAQVALMFWTGLISNKAASAAKEALMLNRPFLDLVPDNIIECPHGDIMALQAEFDVHNYGQTAARIDLVRHTTRYWHGENPKTLTENPGAMISPGAKFRLRCYAGDLTGELAAKYATRSLIVIDVRGDMTYVDQFGNSHVKNFGWLCQYSQTRAPFFHMEGANDEADWGNKGQPWWQNLWRLLRNLVKKIRPDTHGHQGCQPKT